MDVRGNGHHCIFPPHIFSHTVACIRGPDAWLGIAEVTKRSSLLLAYSLGLASPRQGDGACPWGNNNSSNRSPRDRAQFITSIA